MKFLLGDQSVADSRRLRAAEAEVKQALRDWSICRMHGTTAASLNGHRLAMQAIRKLRLLLIEQRKRKRLEQAK